MDHASTRTLPCMPLVISLTFLVSLPEAFCQLVAGSTASSGTSTSYGTEFWIPFPAVTVTGLTSSFQYRIYATNPNVISIDVTVLAVIDNFTTSQVLSLPAGSSRFVAFDASNMMQGEGTFHRYAKLTGQDDFGVQVIATEKMDAFSALPMTSWGNSYLAVTYCGGSDGPCQIVIISHATTQVKVMLPAQDENTISMTDTSSRASSMTVSFILNPGDVYQLQRDFDITGASIDANVSIGVLTGAANAVVGKGHLAGAFMEFLPPVRTLGMSYVVFLTPLLSSGSDFVRVVAFRAATNVYISSEYQRFQLTKAQYITRRFDQRVLLVEADKPIMVVKYSQSDQFNQNVGYPTMTFIPPTELYLQGATVVVGEVTGFTNTQQYAIVVATKSFMQQTNAGTAVNLTGTNMAVDVIAINVGTGSRTLVDPSVNGTAFMVYSYLVSEEVTFQIPVAFSQVTINQPCSLAENSPGDNVDNDCDGQVDEDACNDSNYGSYSDCGDIISGDRDVWGKEFTLQVPDHCRSSLDEDIVLLFVTARDGAPVSVTVRTPLDLTKVMKNQTLSASDNFTIFNLTGAAIKGNGSNVIPDQTLLITSSDEVSITLIQVCTILGYESIMTSRLIPNDVLGREYFTITVCTKDKCQIQVTAVHKGTTEVRVRLRLQYGSTPFMFNSVEYQDGETMSVSLMQYQSLQLQSEQRDMTGTHILTNKPVSVLSGGRFTWFKKTQVADGFVEQLPPVESWGRNFIVQSSPVTKTMLRCYGSPCLDYLKVVACTAKTVVVIFGTSEIDYTLETAGDFLEIPLQAVYTTVKSTKPVLIMQITQEVLGIALSGSIVTPRDQYLNTDRVVVPVVSTVDMYLMITADQINPPGDALKINNIAVSMNTSASLNASFYVAILSSSNFTQLSSAPLSGFVFGGHVYGSGGAMAGLFQLAHAVTELNPVCVISKGVPGDNIDNDCDGQVDEELCDPADVAKDVDNDAMMNEDCQSLPVSSVISSNVEPLSTLLLMSSETPIEEITKTTSLSLLETPHPTSLLDTVLEATTFSAAADVQTLSSTILSDIASLSPSAVSVAIDTLSSTSLIPSVASAVLASSFAAASAQVSISSCSICDYPSNLARPTLSITTPTIIITNGIACGCHCPSTVFTTILDASQVDQLTSAIQKELYVDKDEVSATRRKYISIGDERPSAQTVGYFGVAIIIATLVGIFFLDVGALTRDFANLVRMCRGQG